MFVSCKEYQPTSVSQSSRIAYERKVGRLLLVGHSGRCLRCLLRQSFMPSGDHQTGACWILHRRPIQPDASFSYTTQRGHIKGVRLTTFEDRCDNIRRPLCFDPAVIGFLDACNEEFELMNRGARAEQHGRISLRGEEAAEYERIQKTKAQFSAQMLPLYPKVGPYGPCWCGSGKKVKWCHGATR